MKLVQAQALQLEAVAALFNAYRQFYGQPDDLGKARAFVAERMAKQESTIFLALLDDKAAGFVQLYASFCSVEASPIWILYDLYVAESARQSGVGRALMGQARQLATETGASRIDLSTATDNRAAQKLYESLGYQQDNGFLVYSLTL